MLNLNIMEEPETKIQTRKDVRFSSRTSLEQDTYSLQSGQLESQTSPEQNSHLIQTGYFKLGKSRNFHGHKKDCCGCHACSNICPKNCITMTCDEEGFLYPEINQADCIQCGLCGHVCPTKHPFHSKPPIRAYAAKAKDIELRSNSSSGGIFSILAEYVIKNNGIVFGAELNDEFSCFHGYTDNKKDYKRFRGSKYVQSIIGETYIKVKEFLKEGRLVLFTGCPCQISGLKHYLSKDYENLICADIICHGVPSPKIFRSYKISLETKYRQKLKSIQFRTKKKNWKLMPVSLTLSDGTKHLIHNDKYYLGFLNGLFLRPSCYHCMANQHRSGSDITLGDYWGIEMKHPDFDDEQGISLILINTLKGHDIIKKLKDVMTLLTTDFEHAKIYQPNLNRSSIEHRERTNLYQELQQGTSFHALADKYINLSAGNKIKAIIGPSLYSNLKKVYYKISYKLKS